MGIQINPKLLKVLETIADQQHRQVNDVIEEVLEAYLASRRVDAEFEAAVERIMTEHRWLLDELKKQ
jgi:hypothetical protein